MAEIKLPELPFSPYLMVDWSSGEKGKTMYDADQMRAYAEAAANAGKVDEYKPEHYACIALAIGNHRSYQYLTKEQLQHSEHPDSLLRAKCEKAIRDVQQAIDAGKV